MLLVKLGGSVITHKARLRTPRPDAIRRLARELAAVRQPLFVVHGAGSFGHILARRYRLTEGARTAAARLGAARVQQDVRALNALVVDALMDAGLAAIAVPPSSVVTFSDGRVGSTDFTPFVVYASGRFTPVTFGDVVHDATRGVSVCSGDVLMLELARTFRPDRAVFVADVDGLYTADPKRSRSAKRLDEVRPEDLTRIRFSAARRTDVTGSIEAKIHRMFEIAAFVKDCRIVNGTVPNRVRDALRGRRVVGTRVMPGP